GTDSIRFSVWCTSECQAFGVSIGPEGPHSITVGMPNVTKWTEKFQSVPKDRTRSRYRHREHRRRGVFQSVPKDRTPQPLKYSCKNSKTPLLQSVPKDRHR